MGTLAGHGLPGSFFLIFGIWWSFITSIRYVQSKMKSPYKKNSLVGYKGTVTMPCICLPCGNLRRAPIESILKATLAIVGIIGELWTGFHYTQRPKYKLLTTSHPMEMPMEHQHGKRDVLSVLANSTHVEAPIIEMYDTWFFIIGNGQHITMYSAFVLGSFVEILRHYHFDIPAKLEYVTGILAFGVEAYLFAFHLHGKDALETHIHVLLVYSIIGCALFCCLEWYNQHEVLFTYGRIICTILQGTWFWQIGFILYGDEVGLEHWDPTSHDQIMIITMSFCWHIFFIIVGLLCQLWIIKRAYASKRVSIEWDELMIIDSIHNRESSMTVNKSINHGEETTQFTRLLSEDDESGDEKVEFIKNSHTQQSSSGNSSGISTGHKSPI